MSPQDNAYELMKLFPDGDRVFEIISRYDDLLTLEEKEGYEPGDTLALILPFLLLHGISEEDIAALATKASFVDGAEKLISWLQSKGWKVFCITTTYEPYAMHLTHKLGIFSHNVACTALSWGKLQLTLGADESALLKQAEKDILAMTPGTDDDRIKRTLDKLFWEKLPGTDLGETMKSVKPVGGRRKVAALSAFAEKYDQPLADWVVIGDSITDFRMLEAVDSDGGLAVAFNANQYALPHATMSLAARDVGRLNEVLEPWRKKGRKGVEKAVRGKEKRGSDEGGYFHWLSGREDISEIVSIHERLRRLVREEAGKLG